jgi:hypothetical protein
MTSSPPMRVTQRNIDWVLSLGIPGSDNALKALMERGEIVLVNERGGHLEHTPQRH